MLVVNKLCFSFHSSKTIFKHVSFDLKSGEILSILGPNGTGKTTLLKCLLGLYRFHGGYIHYDGVNLSDLSKNERAKIMAYVPQTSALAFPYSVWEVVMMGRLPQFHFGRPPQQEDIIEVEKVLDNLSIGHLSDKLFQQLSGGEKQLVLLARALAQNAKLLIMDEPTSALDFANQVKTLSMVHLLANKGYSILMTTHSPDHALWISDKVLMLKDGNVFSYGSSEQTISSEKLSELYGINVIVSNTDIKLENRTVKTCVPLVLSD